MISVYISLIVVFLVICKALSPNPDNDLIKVTELYDTIIDLITNKEDGDYNCGSRLNDLKDLLADDLQHCYAGFASCMNKDQFIAGANAHCNEYKEVDDFIQITSRSTPYNPSISLSVKLVHTTMDDCQVTKTYNETITYNAEGLITKIDVPTAAEESEICPGYAQPDTTRGYAGEEGLPPIAEDDYAMTQLNTPVMIDVMDNDYDPDQDGVPGKQSLVIEDFTQGNKGKVELKGNKLRYKPNKDECGSDTFTYYIADLDDGLLASANVYVDIACPTPPYQDDEYAEQPTVDLYAELNKKISDSMCKSKPDKIADAKYKFCVDIEYEAVCPNYAGGCQVFGGKRHGRDSYLDLQKQYDDMFDEATFDMNHNGYWVIQYRKGSCSGTFKIKADVQYDAGRGCISKWIDYVEDIEMTDTDCDNNAAKLFYKLTMECQYDEDEDNGDGYAQPVTTRDDGYASVLAPEANDDYITVPQNQMTRLYVLANDKDLNNPELSGRDTLDIVTSTDGNKGKVYISPTGKRLRYIPFDNECGDDSFDYTVNNDNGLTDTATVYIAINCDNGYITEPATGSYGEGPYTRIDTPPIPNPDYEYGYGYGSKSGSVDRQYENLKVDVPVEDPLEGGYMMVTNTVELEYIADDLIKIESSLGVDAASISLVDAWYKSISEYRIRYRCQLEYVGHAPDPVILEDGSMTQLGGALSTGYIEYDVVDRRGEKKGYVREYSNKLGRSLCKSKKDRSYDTKDILCDDFEYEAICNYDATGCSFMAGKKGRDDFLNFWGSYDNMFDDAEVEFDDYRSRFVIAYRKGSCSGTYMNTAEIEYNTEKQCISKWVDYMDDVHIDDQDCDNNISKLMTKIQTECKFDDEDDNEYATKSGSNYDQKKQKMRELGDKIGKALCKSKPEKAIDTKDEYCVDMQYKAICNNGYGCSSFAVETEGRDAFLEYNAQYENMFDEVTFDIEDGATLLSYRKGSCQGQLIIRADVEYDEDNQCISKWVEYLDDIGTTDQDCANSLEKFMYKITMECEFDDDDNGYITEPVADSYKSVTTQAPILVKKERADKLKLFYRAAFDCRLKKNTGNTQLLDLFMGYLSDTCQLCVVQDSGDETCYDKDEIRSMMSDRYVDANEAIDYQVEITYNDGKKIESKCTSWRKQSNGLCIVKEEYDTCLFNDDGSIKEFKVNRSERRTIECEDEDNYDEE